MHGKIMGKKIIQATLLLTFLLETEKRYLVDICKGAAWTSTVYLNISF